MRSLYICLFICHSLAAIACEPEMMSRTAVLPATLAFASTESRALASGFPDQTTASAPENTVASHSATLQQTASTEPAADLDFVEDVSRAATHNDSEPEFAALVMAQSELEESGVATVMFALGAHQPESRDSFPPHDIVFAAEPAMINAREARSNDTDFAADRSSASALALSAIGAATMLSPPSKGFGHATDGDLAVSGPVTDLVGSAEATDYRDEAAMGAEMLLDHLTHRASID